MSMLKFFARIMNNKKYGKKGYFLKLSDIASFAKMIKSQVHNIDIEAFSKLYSKTKPHIYHSMKKILLIGAIISK